MTVTRVAHPTLLRTVTVATDAFDLVDVRLTERGYGPVVLLLHGGAGPASVTGYADHLAATRGVRVVTPVHPGFAGTPRPPLLTTAAGLAEVYAALLEELGLDAVTVVGHAVGGWVAAELGLLGSPRVARLVLVDAVGIEAPGFRIADVFSLSFEELADLSYHDPAGRVLDPSTLPVAERAALDADRAALALYAGQPAMADPGLRPRLAGISSPTSVVWGPATGSPTRARPGAGRSHTGGDLDLLPAAGRLPQLEAPGLLDEVIAPRLPAARADDVGSHAA